MIEEPCSVLDIGLPISTISTRVRYISIHMAGDWYTGMRSIRLYPALRFTHTVITAA